MPHEPGSPEDWLRYARGDLALASSCLWRGISFPRVHSIERLINLLPMEVTRTEELLSAARLTAYATSFR